MSITLPIFHSGPPTPPKPVLTAVNNTLNISWAPAWSWADYPVTHYTVTLTNTTDGTVYTNHTNETVWYFTREEGAGPRCDVMVVKVTATSDIGEGVAGQTEGGFPIGMLRRCICLLYTLLFIC